MDNRNNSKGIVEGADLFIVDVLLDGLVGHQLGVGVHLPRALRARAPEAVLELEPHEPSAIVWVPLGEAEAGVHGQDAATAWMLEAGRIHPCFLIGDLDEHVARHAALVAHLPQRRGLVVVLFPHLLQQDGDDGFGLSGRAKAHAFGEGEVGEEVAQCVRVVERQLRFAQLPQIAPVVAEIEGPVLCVPVQTGAVNLKLFIGKLNQSKRTDLDREVRGSCPVRWRVEVECHYCT